VCLTDRSVHLEVSTRTQDFKSSAWRNARRGLLQYRETERREQMELTKKAKRNDAGGKQNRTNGGA
jgi:hypothetical protein